MVKKGIIEALLCALLCAPCAVCGQNPVTLARLYEMAEEQSVSMEAFRTAVESAGKGVGIAKSQWMPDVSGELSVGYLDRDAHCDRLLVVNLVEVNVKEGVCYRMELKLLENRCTLLAVDDELDNVDVWSVDDLSQLAHRTSD